MGYEINEDEIKYNEIVTGNKSLNLLINEKKYSTLSSIKRTDEMDQAFVDWISPKYYDAFVTVYANNRNGDRGPISAALRASFLANKDVMAKLSDTLIHHIDQAIESANDFLKIIRVSKYDAITGLDKINPMLDPLVVTILNKVETEQMSVKKQEFGEVLIEIAGILKRVRRMSDEISFKIYEKVINRLQEINFESELKKEALAHQTKFESKASWHIVVSIIVIILLILRFLSRLD